MKSPVRILLLISSIIFLSACGSDDNKSLFGSWESTTESGGKYYLLISATEISLTSYDEYLECHYQRSFPIENVTANSITTENGTFSYTISGSSLNIEGDLYTASTLNNLQLVSCADPSASGSIEIQVTFNDLPDTLEINHALSSDLWVAISLNVEIDSDSSNDLSLGDLSFNADYYFDENSNSIETISPDQLVAEIFYVDEITTSENGNSWGERFAIESDLLVDTDNNTITFKINKNMHKLLKHVSSSSPISVSARYVNTAGKSQYDSYPDTGGLTLESQDTSDLVDELNDVSGSHSTADIIDINAISVTVTE
jgi:hypothetical protein